MVKLINKRISLPVPYIRDLKNWTIVWSSGLRNHAEGSEDKWFVYDSRGNGTPLQDFTEIRVKGSNRDVGRGYDKVVLNSVLTFMVNSLTNSPVEMVKKCCHEYYTLDELVVAKDLLYVVGDNEVLPRYIRRRDGSSHQETDAVIKDLMDGINKLDEHDMLPRFAVDSIGHNIIPRSIPSEINSISMCEWITTLEHRMKHTEDALGHHK